MQRLMATAICAAVLACAGTVTGASAHAALTHCSIKNNQVFSVRGAPTVVTAKFAEPLDPKKSFMQVFENQADHGLVTEHQVSRVSGPQQMSLRLPHMVRGKYYVLWYTHSAADSHFAAGLVYFQVK